MCAILHGPFSIIFILIQPLTVKKLACSTIFYIDSTIPCIRGHKLSLLKSFFLLGISSSKGFDFFFIHLFLHDMLTILPPWKLNNDSVTICSDNDPFPLCQHQYAEVSYHCWLIFFDFDWQKYPYNLNTFTSRVLGVFPALPLNWWHLLRENFVDISNSMNIWLQFLKVLVS